MKRVLLSLLVVALIATTAFAVAPFAQDPSIYFNAADQELDEAMWVNCVLWVSDGLGAANKDIAADDDMQLTDSVSGNIIVSKRAEAAGQGLEVCFPGQGVPADGIKAEELDGGILFVIKTRR